MTTPVQQNLFDHAAAQEQTKPNKKTNGTIFQIPLDTDENRELHGTVDNIKQAAKDEKAAKNRGNLAKGLLGKFALTHYTGLIAENATLPPSPYTVVNQDGLGITYIVQNKSKQNALSTDQIGKLRALLGRVVLNRILEDKELFFFSTTALAEKAAGRKAKGNDMVADIVFEVVSAAIMETPKLSKQQKLALIKKKTTTHLKVDTLSKVPQLFSDMPSKIRPFFEIVGSAINRYFKS